MKRNILFFFPDQWHVDWLEGNTSSDLPLKTPNINRLKGEGTQFTNAFSPSPLCAPARACMASGKDYRACGVPNNHADYPLDQPTFYQRLREQGYRVASVGKLDLHKNLSNPLDWALDGSRFMKEWGFTEGIDNEGKMDGKSSFLEGMKPKGPYLNYLYQRDPSLAEAYAREPENGVSKNDPYISVVDEEAYCDNWLGHKGMDYLREFPKDQPWFIQVNFTGPHGPFDVTQAMSDKWKNVDFPTPIENSEDHEATNGKCQHYAAMIENIDRLIGEYLAILDEREERENTLIVFAADHGDMMGEHGKYGKCTWYRGSVSVPLIISGPGVKKNRKTDALVMHQDLTASFLDYSEGDTLEGMMGTSLRNLLEGRTDRHRDIVESELVNNNFDWHMTFDGQVKKITDRKGRQTLLYNVLDDPEEVSPGITELIQN